MNFQYIFLRCYLDLGALLEKEQSVDVQLENIRPLPKAQARLNVAKTRKKRTSAILTDSPIKNALVQEKGRTKKNKGIKKKICKRKYFNLDLNLDKSVITEESSGKFFICQEVIGTFLMKISIKSVPYNFIAAKFSIINKF